MLVASAQYASQAQLQYNSLKPCHVLCLHQFKKMVLSGACGEQSRSADMATDQVEELDSVAELADAGPKRLPTAK